MNGTEKKQDSLPYVDTKSTSTVTQVSSHF